MSIFDNKTIEKINDSLISEMSYDIYLQKRQLDNKIYTLAYKIAEKLSQYHENSDFIVSEYYESFNKDSYIIGSYAHLFSVLENEKQAYIIITKDVIGFSYSSPCLNGCRFIYDIEDFRYTPEKILYIFNKALINIFNDEVIG